MKKQDVLIGESYYVKVSGLLTPVKIIRESQYGGWEGINEKTRRAVRIKSAQRLRMRVRPLGPYLRIETRGSLAGCYAYLEECPNLPDRDRLMSWQGVGGTPKGAVLDLLRRLLRDGPEEQLKGCLFRWVEEGRLVSFGFDIARRLVALEENSRVSSPA